jgi:hypothetical protein
MRMTRTSRYRWLPVQIDDFEKWQLGLLEESAQRLGAVLNPGGGGENDLFSGTSGACPPCALAIVSGGSDGSVRADQGGRRT